MGTKFTAIVSLFAVLMVPSLASARLVIEDPYAPIACTMEQDCADLGGTTCNSTSIGPLDPLDMCPDTCFCEGIYDFPQDAVFWDAVVLPLEAGALGIVPASTAFTVTRNGVAFGFQSASGAVRCAAHSQQKLQDLSVVWGGPS